MTALVIVAAAMLTFAICCAWMAVLMKRAAYEMFTSFDWLPTQEQYRVHAMRRAGRDVESVPHPGQSNRT